MHAVLELQRELSLEDMERLGVPGVDVEGRSPPAGSGAGVDCSELLAVDEQRGRKLLSAKEKLAFADLDHRPAA
jgi:hypothetical protein